jgi:ATP-dependent protease HslVU (ClpYQ) ATPase subunit
MSDITIPKEISQLSLELYLEDLKKENYYTIQTSKNIEIQLDSLTKKKDRLLGLLLNQPIDQITYESKKREIEEEIESLRDKLNTPKTHDFDMTLELLTKFRNDAICLGNKYRLGNRKIKEELLKSVLWNATIENQKVQNVTYKRPYEYLKKAVNSDDFSVWRTVWDDVGTFLNKN